MQKHHHQNKHMHEPQPYIILIDDDVDDLEMYSSELELKGVNVKTFESSEKGLFYLTLMSGNMELPSLIILDYNMPTRMGTRFCCQLKTTRTQKISRLWCTQPI